jgi:hypothetical protein
MQQSSPDFCPIEAESLSTAKEEIDARGIIYDMCAARASAHGAEW